MNYCHVSVYVSLYIDTEEANVGQKEFEANPKVDMISTAVEFCERRADDDYFDD